jgi:hypothetical protein
MSELRRLGSDDPIAAALFEAARTYRPPVRLRRGTMRALGVPVGLSLLGSALAHAAQAAAPFKAWIVAGVLTAATAGGGALYVSQRLAAPEPAVTAEVARPPVARPRPRPAAAPAPVAATAPLPAVLPAATAPPARPRRLALRAPAPPTLPAPPVAPEPPAAVEPPPVAPAPLPPRPTGTAPLPMPMLPPAAPAPRSTLDAELALIETARSQLGAPRRALATLDEYGLAFPRGALGEEAEILRLSALAAAGARQEAAARAAAFLAAHPQSPLAARARTFLAPSTQAQ